MEGGSEKLKEEPESGLGSGVRRRVRTKLAAERGGGCWESLVKTRSHMFTPWNHRGSRVQSSRKKSRGLCGLLRRGNLTRPRRGAKFT